MCHGIGGCGFGVGPGDLVDVVCWVAGPEGAAVSLGVVRPALPELSGHVDAFLWVCVRGREREGVPSPAACASTATGGGRERRTL